MTKTNNTNSEDIFNFPCEFPIKAIGKNNDNFQQLILELIQVHIETIHPKQITVNPSKNNKFLSVTIRILATSKPQLDAIYTDLHNHNLVLYTL